MRILAVMPISRTDWSVIFYSKENPKPRFNGKLAKEFETAEKIMQSYNS
jgi:hypothetical protein